MMKRNIVLNIPHASINGVFDPKYGGWPCNQYFVNNCLNKWTDWYTDFLFLPLSRQKDVSTVVFPYSRFVCDAERLENDPLEEIGQGIIYTQFNGLKRNINDDERQGLMGYYHSYIKQLKSMLNEHSLLIDCHSFPSDLADVDICIGVNDDRSRPTDFVIELVTEVFKQFGFSVRINHPYSNAIALQTDFVYNSIMIELNKRIYLNEQTLELIESANKIRTTLDRLYMLLLNYSEEV